MLIEIAGIGLAVLLAALMIFRRDNKPETQLHQAQEMVTEQSQKQQPDRQKVAVMFGQLYSIVKRALETGQEPLLYKAIDILKLAFGSGIASKDEPRRLMAVIVGAIQSKHLDAAGHLIDSFRPLFRRREIDDMPQLLNHMATIAAMAMKSNANFLAARVMENIFVSLERADRHNHEGVLQASFQALEKIGKLAIRHQDEALFREMAVRFIQWSDTAKAASEYTGAGHCLSAWLYQVINKNDPTVLPVLDHLAESLGGNGLMKGRVLQELLSTWTQLAGTACMNPNSTVAPKVIERILSLAMNTRDIAFFRVVLQGLGQICSMALTRYGIEDAFVIVLPVAEAGRRLLQDEIMFGPSEVSAFRPQAIHLFVKELLSAFGHLARQRMIITTGEVVGEFHDLWHYRPDLTESYGKSARTFCQLLLSFWMQNHKSKARRIELVGSAKKELNGFSQSDRDKLQFILQ